MPVEVIEGSTGDFAIPVANLAWEAGATDEAIARAHAIRWRLEISSRATDVTTWGDVFWSRFRAGKKVARWTVEGYLVDDPFALPTWAAKEVGGYTSNTGQSPGAGAFKLISEAGDEYVFHGIIESISAASEHAGNATFTISGVADGAITVNRAA